MKPTLLATWSVLATLVLIGCDKKEEGNASSAIPAAPTMMDKAKDAAAGAAAAASDQAGKAVETVKEQTKVAVDSAKDAATPLIEEAKGWVTKATDALKANNLTDAKTYIDKLEAAQSQLPQWLQDQIGNLKTLYEAAQAKGLIPGGLKLP